MPDTQTRVVELKSLRGVKIGFETYLIVFPSPKGSSAAGTRGSRARQRPRRAINFYVHLKDCRLMSMSTSSRLRRRDFDFHLPPRSADRAAPTLAWSEAVRRFLSNRCRPRPDQRPRIGRCPSDDQGPLPPLYEPARGPSA